MLVKRQLYLFAAVVFFLAGYGFVQVHKYREAMEKASTTALRQAPVQLPPARFYDAMGRKMGIDFYSHNVRLVNVWATWCPPCIAELPSLDRLQGKLKKERFKVMAISIDKDTTWWDLRDWYEAQKLDHLMMYWDRAREVQARWQYKGIPVSFLIDREGNVVEVFEGPHTWDEGPVFEKIKQLVDQPR